MLPNGPDSVLILAVTDLLVTLLACLLHLFGIFLLRRMRLRKNIHIILQNLAASEVILGTIRCINIVSHVIYSQPEEHKLSLIPRTLTDLALVPTYMIVTMATAVDPFMMAVYGVKYRRMVTKRRVTIGMGVCWLSAVPGVVFTIMLNYKEQDKVRRCLFPTLCAMFFLFTSFVYIYIGRHLKNKRHMIPRYSKFKRQLSLPKMALKTPSLILFTFVIFMGVSSVIQGQMQKSISADLFWGIIYSCGMCSDAVIYLYCNTKVRNELRRFLKYRYHSNRDKVDIFKIKKKLSVIELMKSNVQLTRLVFLKT